MCLYTHISITLLITEVRKSTEIAEGEDNSKGERRDSVKRGSKGMNYQQRKLHVQRHT